MMLAPLTERHNERSSRRGSNVRRAQIIRKFGSVYDRFMGGFDVLSRLDFAPADRLQSISLRGWRLIGRPPSPGQSIGVDTR